jgi:PAS domain-containing protein
MMNIAISVPAIKHMTPVPTMNVEISIGLLVILIAGIVFLAFMLRKFMRSQASGITEDWTSPKADVENPSAFMTASMQGVIEKLRAQEKELARLHLLAQERAQESERLTEEVTRNMPTGLLLVSATGAITSTNPAAEDALGIRTLRYRSYKEILGAESDLTRMLTACIRDGKTFQRGEIEHMTSEGEVRHLDVTISPIYRTVRAPVRLLTESAPSQGTEMKVSGALCLMSDLTELTALQKQIRWKENLAALGEMSAGIAHEFKIRADDSQ